MERKREVRAPDRAGSGGVGGEGATPARKSQIGAASRPVSAHSEPNAAKLRSGLGTPGASSILASSFRKKYKFRLFPRRRKRCARSGTGSQFGRIYMSTALLHFVMWGMFPVNICFGCICA